jgi:hypothetical protein
MISTQVPPIPVSNLGLTEKANPKSHHSEHIPPTWHIPYTRIKAPQNKKLPLSVKLPLPPFFRFSGTLSLFYRRTVTVAHGEK